MTGPGKAWMHFKTAEEEPLLQFLLQPSHPAPPVKRQTYKQAQRACAWVAVVVYSLAMSLARGEQEQSQAVMAGKRPD